MMPTTYPTAPPMNPHVTAPPPYGDLLVVHRYRLERGVWINVSSVRYF